MMAEAPKVILPVDRLEDFWPERFRGARVGATAGGLMGGMRRADSNRQQQQWAQQEAANYQNERNNWNRAFSACMESRGYTVG